MEKIKGYLSLFLTMLKIGLFTFGGGYAMIALLENEFVEKKKWLEKDEFLDVAVGPEPKPELNSEGRGFFGQRSDAVWEAFGIYIPIAVVKYLRTALVLLDGNESIAHLPAVIDLDDIQP